MIGGQFNISSINRTAAGNLLRKIYTNTSFQEDTGAFVRVRTLDLCSLYIDYIFYLTFFVRTQVEYALHKGEYGKIIFGHIL